MHEHRDILYADNIWGWWDSLMMIMELDEDLLSTTFSYSQLQDFPHIRPHFWSRTIEERRVRANYTWTDGNIHISRI